MEGKLGKVKLYKLARDFFKDIEFPERKEVEYYYCSFGHNEVLSFPGYIISRNIYSQLFILRHCK